MTEKDYLIKILQYRQNQIDSMLEDDEIFWSEPVRQSLEEESAALDEIMEHIEKLFED